MSPRKKLTAEEKKLDAELRLIIATVAVRVPPISPEQAQELVARHSDGSVRLQLRDGVVVDAYAATNLSQALLWARVRRLRTVERRYFRAGRIYRVSKAEFSEKGEGSC